MNSPDTIIDQHVKPYADTVRSFNDYWFYSSFRFMYKGGVILNSPYTSQRFTIAEDGFRGGPYTPRKIGTRPRVAFIGASALVGIPNLANNETIPAFTNQFLKTAGLDVEVLNLGVISYNITQELHLLIKILVEYDVDQVVLYSGYNDAILATNGELWSFLDIDSIMQEAFHPDRDQSVFAIKRAAARTMENLKRAPYMKSKRLPEYLRKRRVSNMQERVPVYHLSLKAYTTQLELFIHACQKAKIGFTYCFQPNLYSTKKSLSEYEKARMDTLPEFGTQASERSGRIEKFRIYNERLCGAVSDVLHETASQRLDAESILATLPSNASVFYDYCHVTRDGAEILGRAFADALKKSLS